MQIASNERLAAGIDCQNRKHAGSQFGTHVPRVRRCDAEGHVAPPRWRRQKRNSEQMFILRLCMRIAASKVLLMQRSYEELKRERLPILLLLSSIAVVAVTVSVIAYSVPDRAVTGNAVDAAAIK